MMNPKKIILKKTGKTETPERDQRATGKEDSKYHYIPQPCEDSAARQPSQKSVPESKQPVSPAQMQARQNVIPVKIVAPVIESQASPPPPRIIPPKIETSAAPPPTRPSAAVPPATIPVPNPNAATVFDEKKAVVKGKLVSPQSEWDDVELLKEQLQNYLELTDALNNPKWTFSGIIDILYVLIESIDIDVLAVAMIDFSAGKKLCPLVSRGFKNPPDETISAIWEKAIGDGPSINWNSLMTIASSATSDLSKWISKEGLDSLGYVPIHDNKTIFGFMFIGNHGKKSPSPLASSILELCGGRLGIVITLRKLQGEWPVKV